MTLQPVCRGCRFINERSDCYCGGCGLQLGAVSGVMMDRAVTTTPKIGKSSSELAELFSPTNEQTPQEVLPAAGITQDDLDRLFGVVP